MQYELRNSSIEGPFKDNQDGTGIQNVIIVTGIVGDKHDFLRMDNVPITLDTTKSINENKTALTQKILEFIAQKYPNT
jgi:hypothetical protein